MNLQKLNEEILQLLELSDKTKQSYLAGRERQAKLAQAKLDKARRQVNKSNVRQYNNLPDETNKENASDAIYDLKSEMRRISSGSDWNITAGDDCFELEVRYWGEWENPEDAEDEEDYDWQVLSDEYKQKLNDIIYKIGKKYKVQIEDVGSEKNWLCLRINFVPEKEEKKEEPQKIKELSTEEKDKLWKDFLSNFRSKDITGPIQRKKGTYHGTINLFSLSTYVSEDDNEVYPEYGHSYVKIYQRKNTDGSAYYEFLGLNSMNRIYYDTINEDFEDGLNRLKDYLIERNTVTKDKYIANAKRRLEKLQKILDRLFKDFEDIGCTDVNSLRKLNSSFDISIRFYKNGKKYSLYSNKYHTTLVDDSKDWRTQNIFEVRGDMQKALPEFEEFLKQL